MHVVPSFVGVLGCTVGRGKDQLGKGTAIASTYTSQALRGLFGGSKRKHMMYIQSADHTTVINENALRMTSSCFEGTVAWRIPLENDVRDSGPELARAT